MSFKLLSIKGCHQLDKTFCRSLDWINIRVTWALRQVRRKYSSGLKKSEEQIRDLSKNYFHLCKWRRNRCFISTWLKRISKTHGLRSSKVTCFCRQQVNHLCASLSNFTWLATLHERWDSDINSESSFRSTLTTRRRHSDRLSRQPCWCHSLYTIAMADVSSANVRSVYARSAPCKHASSSATF